MRAYLWRCFATSEAADDAWAAAAADATVEELASKIKTGIKSGMYLINAVKMAVTQYM